MQGQIEIKVWKFLKEAFNFFKINFKLFMTIALIGQALGLVNALQSAIFGSERAWFTAIIALAGFVVSFWAYIALIIAVSQRYLNQEITAEQALRDVKSKFWRFAGINFLYGLICVGGFLLLIIPGAYWSIVFSLAPIIAILESKEVKALSASKALIKDYFWKVALLSMVLMLIALPVFIVLMIGSVFLAITNPAYSTILGMAVIVLQMFFMAFAASVSVKLYYTLKNKKEEVVPTL